MVAQSSSGAKLASWLAPFRSAFTTPSYAKTCVLIAGALRTPSRRTVTAALHLSEAGTRRHVTNYHRLLNRARWSGRELGRWLLLLLVAAFAPTGPVVIGIDDWTCLLKVESSSMKDEVSHGRTEEELHP